MSVFAVGIDVSKKTLDVCALVKQGKQHQQFSNTPQGHEALAQWLEQWAADVHIALEATGRYGDAVASYLYSQGYAVSLINPLRVKAFGQSLLSRAKTDRHDAYLIALFCQMHRPALWQPSTPIIIQLKEQTRYLKSLKQMRQQEVNRLKSGLQDQCVKAILETNIAHLEQQIQHLEKQIHQAIRQDPALSQAYQLLDTIPGLGKTTIPILLAEIGRIDRFGSAGQLACYAGITPKLHQSGTSVYKRSRISKQGNKHLRTALYFPAIVAKSKNPICLQLAQRLEKEGKAGKQIVVAVMRKLLHLAYGVLKSGQAFDPNFVKQIPIAA